MSGKGPNKPLQVFFLDARCELNAGEACCGQQLRKAAFGRSRFDGRAVEQQLRAAGAEQQPGFIGNGNRFVEFGPGRLKLFGCARMIEAVEPRVLEQNVEAADKRARGRPSWYWTGFIVFEGRRDAPFSR